MKVIKSILITSLLLFSSHLYSQTEYSLRDCVLMGIEKNFNILIAQNELKMAQNASSTFNSDFLPTLNLGATYNASWDATTTTTHDDVTTQSNAYYLGASAVGLYLNWTIFDGLNNVANFQRLKAQMHLQEVQTMIAIEDYILSMAQEYFTYIAIKQQMNVQKQILSVSEERMRIAKVKYENGSSSNLEFLQAKVDFNNDSTLLIETSQTLELQRIKLNNLMMIDDLQSADWEIGANSIECNNTITFDQLWNNCLNKNSSLLAAQKQTDISVIDLKATRSVFFPTIALSGGYEYQLNYSTGGSYKSRNVSNPNIGVTFSIPLISFKDIQTHKNSKLTKINAELAQKEMERQLKVEFTSNWIAYQNYLNLITLKSSNLASSQTSLDAATLQYKQSQISGLQLREAQNSYLQNQYDLLEVNLNAKLKEIYLIFLSGNSTTLY